MSFFNAFGIPCDRKECKGCGIKECQKPQDNYVRIGYVEGKPNSIGIFSSWGNSSIDLTPVTQATETNTNIELNKTDREIDYFPELYLSSGGYKGCVNRICLTDVFALMHLNEIGDVDVPNPHTGDTIVYDETVHKWRPFALFDKLRDMDRRIDQNKHDIEELNKDLQAYKILVEREFDELRKQVEANRQAIMRNTQNIANLGARVSDIEGAIYNWANDKNTKIPRGNINVFSGAFGGPNYIRSRDGTPDNDLRFE